MSGHWSIVAVSRSVPRRLASAAGTGSAKKIQAWAPLPERDRSMATGPPRARAVSRKAATSRIQDFLSKSAARNQHVSSGSIAFDPGERLGSRIGLIVVLGVGKVGELG